MKARSGLPPRNWAASSGATAAGILNTGGNGGGIIAPVVTPALSEIIGWQAGIGLASIVCLIGAALWYWIDLSNTDGALRSQPLGLLGSQDTAK